MRVTVTVFSLGAPRELFCCNVMPFLYRIYFPITCNHFVSDGTVVQDKTLCLTTIFQKRKSHINLRKLVGTLGGCP